MPPPDTRNSRDFSLSFFNKLSISFVEMPAEIVQLLGGRFGLFTVDFDPHSDVQVRFVRSIEHGEDLSYLNPNFASDDQFLYVIHNGLALLAVPRRLYTSGGTVSALQSNEAGLSKIVAEFIRKIIMGVLLFSMNRAEMSMLHAASISYNGKGLVLGGWGGVGKTSTMLSLMEKGAKFLSNDWTPVAAAGRILAFPFPVILTSYNLTEQPYLLQRLKRHPQLVRHILQRKVMDIVANIGKHVPHSLVREIASDLQARGSAMDESLELTVGVPDLLGRDSMAESASLDMAVLLKPAQQGPVRISATSREALVSGTWPYVRYELGKAFDPLVYIMDAMFPEDRLHQTVLVMWEGGMRITIRALGQTPVYTMQMPRRLSHEAASLLINVLERTDSH